MDRGGFVMGARKYLDMLRWVEGREIQVFTEMSESALLGYAGQSAAKARRLRNEADKLEAFCLVVRAAATAADQVAFAEVSRAAGKTLRAKFGGGSITSAFAWLAGRAGREALDSVLAGEVELSGPISVQEVVEALDLGLGAEGRVDPRKELAQRAKAGTSGRLGTAVAFPWRLPPA